MRISSSVGPAVADGAAADFVLRAAFFVGALFFILVDARRGFILSIWASAGEAISTLAGLSFGAVFVRLGTA
jgi:hypothetical protein